VNVNINKVKDWANLKAIVRLGIQLKYRISEGVEEWFLDKKDRGSLTTPILDFGEPIPDYRPQLSENFPIYP
jgi:hypothetical protein